MEVEKSNTGYILEVDLHYPRELQEKHSDYPLCAESLTFKNVSKLCLTLKDKNKYICHIGNLQQAMKYGLRLKKVYRVMKFHQSAWMKSFVDETTKRRMVASSKSEQDFHKLTINAIYGKTCENPEKRCRVYLCTGWEDVGNRKGAALLIASGHLKSRTIINDNLIVCELHKLQVSYDKPIQVGKKLM